MSNEIDLKQFREAVECWHDAALPANSVDAERKAEAKRLLALIDNAGKVECSEVSGYIATVPDKCDRVIWRGKYYHLPPRQPAPVVDGEVRFNAAFFVNNAGNRIEQLTTYEDYRRDGAVLALMDLGQKRASAKKLTKKGGGRVVLAWVSAPQLIIADDDSFFAYQPAPEVDDTRMARALEWVRAECGFYNNAEARTHLSAIEEAIAAYDPNCGARTVRVVDDAMADQIIKGNVDLVPAEHQTLEQRE